MDEEKEWKAPRELMRSAPREVRLTKSGMVLTGLALAFLAGALALAILLGGKVRKEGADRTLLNEQGVEGQAVVTRLWRGSDEEHPPMVAYEFNYDGRIYRHSTRAPQQVWKTLTEGSPVRIRLLPSHPANNMPLDWQGDGPLPAAVAVVAPAIFVFGGLVILGLLRSQRRLLSEGRVAMGVVLKSRRSSHGKREFTYEYTLPGGKKLTRRSGQVHKTLEPGTVVTIVYDPEKPTRSALYPFEMVRVDTETY